MRRFLTVLAALATLSLTNCGYNAIQTNDEQVKASWSEVVNQYQRRADLVPNLVNSVKGFAQQEKDVLLGVTNARAKVGSIQATPDLVNDPAAFQKFQAAQGELSSALSRLLVVTENYPQLKSDALFHDGAAGRHRKPHHGGAQPLHQVGAGLQCRHPHLSEQPDRDGVRI
jgi:LemA protein